MRPAKDCRERETSDIHRQIDEIVLQLQQKQKITACFFVFLVAAGWFLSLLSLLLSPSDIKDIRYVVNFDMPNNIEDYVHRIGRTGRAGRTGTSYSFFTPDNAKLSRDLILLSEADEEAGSTGIQWLIQHAAPKIDAEFAFNEGGSVWESKNGTRVFLIQTSEKIPTRVVLTAKGPAGHGSLPRPDNAVLRLSRAIRRIRQRQTFSA